MIESSNPSGENKVNRQALRLIMIQLCLKPATTT